jgi:hypothetical protein
MITHCTLDVDKAREDDWGHRRGGVNLSLTSA